MMMMLKKILYLNTSVAGGSPSLLELLQQSHHSLFLSMLIRISDCCHFCGQDYSLFVDILIISLFFDILVENEMERKTIKMRIRFVNKFDPTHHLTNSNE